MLVRCHLPLQSFVRRVRVLRHFVFPSKMGSRDLGCSMLFKNILVDGWKQRVSGVVCVGAFSLSITLIRPKSALLLFPDKLLQHIASLFDDSVATRRQNCSPFISLAPSFVSPTFCVFPKNNNLHSSPCCGNKLI